MLQRPSLDGRCLEVSALRASYPHSYQKGSVPKYGTEPFVSEWNGLNLSTRVTFVRSPHYFCARKQNNTQTIQTFSPIRENVAQQLVTIGRCHCVTSLPW